MRGFQRKYYIKSEFKMNTDVAQLAERRVSVLLEMRVQVPSSVFVICGKSRLRCLILRHNMFKYKIFCDKL